MLATLTPDRSVSVILDAPGTTQAEPFFARSRVRFQIQNAVLENVEQLASGVWILKPENSSYSTLHETTSGQASVMRLSEFTHPSQVQEIPVQRSLTEIPGASPDAAVSAQGDWFNVKRMESSLASWNIGQNSPTPVPPLPTTPHYPLDMIMQHQGALDPVDQGYIIRWVNPNHYQGMPDYLASFQFGGELTAGGYGLFEIVIGGEGTAFLFEWIGGAWQEVDRWRWSTAGAVPSMGHTLRIIPHVGKFIEIKSHITDSGGPGFAVLVQRLTAFAGKEVAHDVHTYEAKNRSGLPPLGSGNTYPMTGPGHPRLRARRDLLLRWQIARVTYPASGTLIDEPFTVRQVNTSAHVLTIRRFSMVVKNPTTGADHGNTSAVALNAITGSPLTPGSEAWPLRSATVNLFGYLLPGRPNAIKIKITLTNNDGAGGTYSPWLFGYEAFKIGENSTAPSAPLTISADHYRQSPVTRVSISGPDFDPSHETASLRICDLVNRCSRLGVRGEGTLKILTTYDPGDQAKQAVLFDGFWTRSEGKLRGKLGKSYPSPNWHDYEVQCLGRWKRLAERDFVQLEAMNFATDPNITAPPPPQKGVIPPWKVTDVIWHLLVLAGVPESQLDIPDLPIRLWHSGPEADDKITIQPGTGLGDFIRHLAEDYLNGFLIWDANAGSAGKWRLKIIPTGTEPSVWTFTDQLPPPGRIATHAGAYPANTTWVARDTLMEWTIPPEGSWVCVTGEDSTTKLLISREADNPKAYNRPGANTADPTHPDYVDGTFRPIFRKHDPTLTTVEAVQFILRRIFNIACRAQQFARFMCPVVLIDAASFEPAMYTTYRRRPLMFGDVVTFRGRKAMVRQANIVFVKQHHMLMTGEVTFFNSPFPV